MFLSLPTIMCLFFWSKNSKQERSCLFFQGHTWKLRSRAAGRVLPNYGDVHSCPPVSQTHNYSPPTGILLPFSDAIPYFLLEGLSLSYWVTLHSLGNTRQWGVRGHLRNMQGLTGSCLLQNYSPHLHGQSTCDQWGPTAAGKRPYRSWGPTVGHWGRRLGEVITASALTLKGWDSEARCWAFLTH